MCSACVVACHILDSMDTSTCKVMLKVPGADGLTYCALAVALAGRAYKRIYHATQAHPLSTDLARFAHGTTLLVFWCDCRLGRFALAWSRQQMS